MLIGPFPMIYFGELPTERLPFRPVCSVIPQTSWLEPDAALLETAFANVVVHHEYPGQCFFPVCDMLSVDSIGHGLDARVLWTLAYYLALGLDPRKAIVYRQSDLPELSELAFLITRFARNDGGMDLSLLAADIVGVKGSRLLDGGGCNEQVAAASAIVRHLYRELGLPEAKLEFVEPTKPSPFPESSHADVRERAARLFGRPERLENVLRDGSRMARAEVMSTLRLLKTRAGVAIRGKDVEDRAFLGRVSDVDWSAFVRTQRKNGRRGLDAEFRRFTRSLYQDATRLANTAREETVRSVADLVSRIAYPFAREHADGYPTYYSYADVGLLDWYTRCGPEGTLGQLQHTLQGLRVLLLEHRGFEVAARDAPTYAASQIPFDRLPARLAQIDLMLREVRVMSLTLGMTAASSLPPEPQAAVNLEHAAKRPLLVLQTFCPIPQTTYHDEVLFLTAVQTSELVFWGMRQCCAASVTADSPRDAEIFLCLGAWFAKLLYQAFLVLRTMPNDSFAEFRDYTGRASAVQSRSYQIFDILYRGLDDRKMAHLAEYDHLRDLVGWGHPALRSISSTLDGAPGDVADAARELDATLLQWRGLHLAFAKAYLPAGVVGTGGTSGADYLRRFLRNGLFSELGKGMSELDIDADGWDSFVGLGVSPPDHIQKFEFDTE